MKILVSIGHPAHVHFYKNFIWEAQSDGHDVEIVTKDKDIAINLLDAYEFEYEILYNQPEMSSIWAKASYIKYEVATLKKVLTYEPDVVTGIMAVALSHAATIARIPSVVFADTEHASMQNFLSFTFADRVCTPDCYQDDIGEKQIRYPGYHELAYLHPNRFDPDPSILSEANLKPNENFIILRLVSWEALHDVGDSGFEDIFDVVNSLEDTGTTVRITSEADLPTELMDRQVTISPHRIHDLMAFAELYIGESATMAAESAVLGTPAIFVSSSRRGYTDELENKYGLVYNYSGRFRHQHGLKKAVELLEQNTSGNWEQRRKQILSDKMDTTNVILNSVLGMV